jgi:hypothetical protein
MSSIDKDASIRLTILSIIADMSFKDDDFKERCNYAEWALDWVTPERPVGSVTELKGLN